MKLKELFEEQLTVLQKYYVIDDFECYTGKFPTRVKFQNTHLIGDFECRSYDLLTLKRAPREITGYFNINGCHKLKSLEFGPIKITGDYTCCDCNTLESLDGAPKEVIGEFWCRDCINLTTLEGAPDRVTSDVNIGECNKLKNLEGIGVKYFKEIGGELTLPENVKYGLLGILKIKNLKNIFIPGSSGDLYKAEKIINKHLKSGRNINKCISELEDAGLEEFAKL